MYKLTIILGYILAVHQAQAASSWCEEQAEKHDWFICDDGKGCVHGDLQCDGKPDCGDESDERGCSEEAPPQDSRPEWGYCYQCTETQKAILDFHNDLRASEPAANMNELNWSVDDQLAAAAQADLCAVPSWGESAHGNMHPDYGQNVARWYYPGNTVTDDQVLEMVKWWYDEKKDYDYDNNACSAVCGHYTAMVSAYERNMGCALKRCDRTKNGERKVFWNLVCNYSVWPNWKVWSMHPKQPYIKGETCSMCQEGLTNRNGLCGMNTSLSN